MQSIPYTIGIELMLMSHIAIADDPSALPDGIAPPAGVDFRFLSRMGWGNTMYHPMLCDDFGAQPSRQIGLIQEDVLQENKSLRQ